MKKWTRDPREKGEKNVKEKEMGASLLPSISSDSDLLSIGPENQAILPGSGSPLALIGVICLGV